MNCDAIVVGLGPGGEHVAGELASAGLSVVSIDAGLVGGECPYWGCIPSKMMLRAAGLLEEGRRIPGMAGASTVSPDWGPVARRIRNEATDSWDDRVAVERLEGKGARFIRGRARVVGPREVEVDGERIAATRALVLSCGESAFVPDMFKAVPHWINREAIECEVLPESLLVIGGGSIGVELGQAFARFGVQVRVVETGPRLVGKEEPEASELLERLLREEGMEIHTSCSIDSVAPWGGGGAAVRLASGEEVAGERMLVATGRQVDLGALGVGVLGVDESARALPVDEFLRVPGVDGVWGVGDITGKGAFTHVSMYQARICIASILGKPTEEADYRALPRVTFTDPEIGSVGMTEAQAREEDGTVTVMSEPIPKSARGWIHRGEGFVKLVALDGVIVGGTSMGPTGGEVLGLMELAVHARVPVETLKSMIYAYPTFYRAIDSAVRSAS